VALDAFFELILGTLFAGRSYETYSAKIVKGDYEPGFRMQLGLKDLRLATAAAEKAGKQLPMLNAVRARMAEAVDAGMGEKDWSGMSEQHVALGADLDGRLAPRSGRRPHRGQRQRRPQADAGRPASKAVGLLSSLGHSTIVVLASLAIAATASAIPPSRARQGRIHCRWLWTAAPTL